MPIIPSDLFGLPGQGLHSYRLFDAAIVDILGTIVISIVLARVLDANFWYVLAGLFILGEVLHYSAGVNTKVIQLIGQ